ncbi:IPT/TIG domain-containing protein [Pseudochryseolinea flava]|nr:IPT/TIG domain-containing protein [Pseudochryseolinea flava]
MKKYYFIIAIFLFSTCTEEEPTSRDYPRVRTSLVTSVTSAGATVEGTITTAPAAIEDHGFVYGETQYPTITSHEVISLGSKAGVGKFSATIEKSLVEKVTYYVRAYAKSSSYIVYGDQVEFMSLGTTKPTLISIAPTQAQWGDTITLTGTNFTKNSKFLTSIGDIDVRSIFVSNDQVKLIIPHTVVSVVNDVSINFVGNSATLNGALTIKKPIISSITPTAGKVNTEVIISGSGFNLNTEVFFADRKATVKSISRQAIKCTVPTGAPNGMTKVTLKAGAETLWVDTDFTMMSPVITQITPLTGTYNDQITIKGQNFSGIQSENVVTVDGQVAEIISSSTTEIRARIPYGISQTPAMIDVTVANIETRRYTSGFVLTRPSITSVTPTRIGTNSEATITGTGFDIYGGNIVTLDGEPVFHSYNMGTAIRFTTSAFMRKHEMELNVITAGQASTNTKTVTSPWITLHDGTNARISNNIIFQHNNEIYAGLGRQTYYGEYSNEMWKFNPTTGWTKLGTFPGGERSHAFAFTLGDKAYIGGGQSDLSTFNDLWEFDLVSHVWTKLNDVLPGDHLWSAAAITHNGKAYLFFYNRFYEYDPLNDSWTPLSYAPNMYSMDAPPIFVHANEIYAAAEGSLWVYNIAADNWTQKNNSMPTSLSYGAKVFSLNGAIYFEDGQDDTDESITWKYDPVTNKFSTFTTRIPIFTYEQSYISMNNKGYLIGGRQDYWGNATSVVYEFDPNY